MLTGARARGSLTATSQVFSQRYSDLLAVLQSTGTSPYSTYYRKLSTAARMDEPSCWLQPNASRCSFRKACCTVHVDCGISSFYWSSLSPDKAPNIFFLKGWCHNPVATSQHNPSLWRPRQRGRVYC